MVTYMPRDPVVDLTIVEYNVESSPQSCRPFRLSSTRSSCRPPTKPRGGRNRIVPLWYAMHYESTSGDCNSALEKKATVRDISGGLRRPLKPVLGRRRRHGRPNSPRGHLPLPVCSTGQEATC